MSRLQAEHLYKVFGRRPDEAVRRLQAGADRDELRADGTTAAVIDASFAVEPGQIFVVMGLSGSGKSTLLRMLNGLLEPTAGRVLFDGEDLTALSPRELRRVRSTKISMVFQHFALFPHRSVLENAAYGLEVQGVARAERERRAAEALELCGLAGWEKSWPDELSGGMQQRVGLARALATDADLLLMDESFSALDPLIRRDMQDQLLELQQRLKKTIVFITHDLNEAMRLGDRIAVMRDGRIVQLGSAEDILVRPANDYVASFIQDVDRSRVLTAGAIMADPDTVFGTADESGEAPRTAADVLAAAPATVPLSTPLAELFTPCSASGAAVAVTDGTGELAGVVTRARLLAALGEPVPETPAAGPPATGRPIADQPVADQATADQPAADQPALGKPAAGPTPGKPAAGPTPGKPAAGPTPGRTTADQRADEPPSDQPTLGQPAAEPTLGRPPAEPAPSQPPHGQPAAEPPPGQAPPGQRADEPPSDQPTLGQPAAEPTLGRPPAEPAPSQPPHGQPVDEPAPSQPAPGQPAAEPPPGQAPPGRSVPEKPATTTTTPAATTATTKEAPRA